MYYDKQGQPMSCEEWCEEMKDPMNKIIQQTTLPNGKWVSTVWLGLDHSFNDETPTIFETMVFPEKGNYMDEVCERYFTLEEAQEGHKRICESYSNCSSCAEDHEPEDCLMRNV